MHRRQPVGLKRYTHTHTHTHIDVYVYAPPHQCILYHHIIMRARTSASVKSHLSKHPWRSRQRPNCKLETAARPSCFAKISRRTRQCHCRAWPGGRLSRRRTARSTSQTDLGTVGKDLQVSRTRAKRSPPYEWRRLTFRVDVSNIALILANLARTTYRVVASIGRERVFSES